MKIIKLLEGSELLYHVTSQDSMLGMLRTGGIQLADLRYSAWERGLMDNSHPSSSGKLYFLSMSRNRANEFSDGMLTAVGKQGLVFRICFSGRTLSKYGKLYPINYYGSNDNRGEMEDRLVGDINLIPFSDFDYVDVLLPRDSFTSDYQRRLIKAVSERVRCRVFDNPKKFFSGRGDIEFDFDVEGEVNLGGNLFGDDGVAEIIIKYFEGGELTDDEKDELRRSKLFNILNTVNTGSEVGHRLRLVLRKAGVKDVKDIEDRLVKMLRSGK